MEDKILCNVSDLEPIADAVREKENTNKLYSVEELKVKVPELIGSSGGTNIGDSLDRLNTINGGTAATTISAAVNNTDTLVSDENTLIEQAIAALEGKSVPGGSPSGGIVETCTVNVTSELTWVNFYAATISENGTIGGLYNEEMNETKTVTFNNVVCGSLLCFLTGAPVLPASNVTNAEFIDIWGGCWIFRITAGSGEIATITVWDDD